MLQALTFPLTHKHPLAAARRSVLNAPARAARHRPREWVEGEILALYIAGWSEADPYKIADATAVEYDFDDPLVGRFSRRSLPQYFELFRTRFAVAGPITKGDLAFTLRGPMQGFSREGAYQYWREAPHLGLTGVARITVTPEGIAADAVAYDLNMACEALRGRSSEGRNVALTGA